MSRVIVCVWFPFLARMQWSHWSTWLFEGTERVGLGGLQPSPMAVTNQKLAYKLLSKKNIGFCNHTHDDL